MIPPLVAILAGLHGEDKRKLQGLLEGGVPEQIFPEASRCDRVPPLPVRLLVPEPPVPSVLDQLLAQLAPEQIVPGLGSYPDGLGVLAGLCQVHDRLEESHRVVQRADAEGRNTTAPYWHGIMHRREPDYDNARYWFRRVGPHPVFPELGREVSHLLARPDFGAALHCDRVVNRRGLWDPAAFIALCEECGRRNDERSRAAAQLQAIEMRHLLEYSWRAARGHA